MFKSNYKTGLICIISSAAITVMTYNCHAAIGDTLEESIVKYGHSLPSETMLGKSSKGDSCYVFKNNGLIMICFFNKGIIDAELIRRKDRAQMALTEQKSILQSETNGAKWTEDTSYGLSGSQIWTRDNGKIAVYNALSASIYISS